jgi:cbb3-type cytochrome oxidase subunit 3
VRGGATAAQFARLAVISPLVLVHVVSGAHNDMLLAALVLGGLAIAAAGPDRPALRTAFTGIAFALAGGVKVTALVAAPFAVLLLLHGRVRPARVLGTGAALAVVIATGYALLAVATGHGLGFLRALDSTSGLVQWLSLPTGVGMAVGYGLRVAGQGPETFAQVVSVTRAIGLAVLVVLLVALWWWAMRRAGRAESTSADATCAVVTATGLAMLATAVLGPVFYAWYAIGGLAVLAATPLTGRLRTAVTVAAGGLIFLTLPDSLGLATKTKVPGAVLDVAVLIVLAVRWTRRSARAATPSRK